MHRTTQGSATLRKCPPIFRRHPHLERRMPSRSPRGLPTGRMRKGIPISPARHPISPVRHRPRPRLPLQRGKSGRRTAQRPHDLPAGQMLRMTTGHRADRRRVPADRQTTRRIIKRRAVRSRAVKGGTVRQWQKRMRQDRRGCLPALPPCSPSQWNVPTDAPVERAQWKGRYFRQYHWEYPVHAHRRRCVQYPGKETRNVSDWHFCPGGFRHTS